MYGMIKIGALSDNEIKVTIPYNPIYITTIKTIKGYWWHPDGKIQELLGHKSSKTTEIYTHVSNRLLSKIKSPLDTILNQEVIHEND
jgi:hypothetical protein